MSAVDGLNGVVAVHEDGSLIVGNDDLNNKKLQLDVSNLSASGIDQFLKVGCVDPDKYTSFTLRQSKLSPSELVKVTGPVLRARLFHNLAHLDLSYVYIPEVVLDSLCEYLSPFSCGYNISRLNVSRCGLGQQGTSKLLNSLFANITLKELLLTGNNCTDACIPDLIALLTKYANDIQIIGLGGNLLTAIGTMEIRLLFFLKFSNLYM